MSQSQAKRKKRPIIRPLLISIVAVTILLIFIVTALLLVPGSALPEFEITDQGGEWKSQGTIAVFDEKVKPGSDGEYEFIISSASEGKLKYGFWLTEYFDTTALAHPVMEYRLKMNGDYIGDGEWHYAGLHFYNLEILPGSELLMTLEWRWQFEGDNENDTLVGVFGGSISVNIFIFAEVAQ